MQGSSRNHRAESLNVEHREACLVIKPFCTILKFDYIQVQKTKFLISQTSVSWFSISDSQHKPKKGTTL